MKGLKICFLLQYINMKELYILYSVMWEGGEGGGEKEEQEHG